MSWQLSFAFQKASHKLQLDQVIVTIELKKGL